MPRFVRENRLVGASERDGGVTVLQSWRKEWDNAGLELVVVVESCLGGPIRS